MTLPVSTHVRLLCINIVLMFKIHRNNEIQKRYSTFSRQNAFTRERILIKFLINCTFIAIIEGSRGYHKRNWSLHSSIVIKLYT